MGKQVFKTKANGIDFYCEMRGDKNKPKVVLIPDGSNDCEPYDNFSKLLESDFNVLTFDMRGGTRSMDYDPKPVTPKMLADDVAAIIKALDFSPATIFGCSSGGQTALSVGKYHPEIVRNIIIHEAALQAEAPIKNTGFDYFKNLETFNPYLTGGLTPGDITLIGNAEKVLGMGEEVRKRTQMNGIFWAKWYRGTVDMDVYSEEDFKRMPPTEFTVGTWTPAWLVYANIETAKRGKCPITWINCAHMPNVTCPEEYTQYMRKVIAKYL